MKLDDAALTDFVRSEFPGVYSLSVRLSGNPESAENLCQAVLSSALRKYPNPADVPSTKNWLYKIIIGEWKSRVKAAKGAKPAADPKNTEPAIRALNSLDPDDKIVLLLREVEMKNAGEIALILDISVNTAKSRLARAREAYRLAVKKQPVKR